MTLGTNTASNQPTRQDYIDKVGEASHNMASVNPAQKDVDTINNSMTTSFASVMSDPANAGKSQKELVDLTMAKAMTPEVNKAVTAISVSGDHNTILGDVSGKIHDGIVNGAQQKIATDIATLKAQQKSVGAPAVAAAPSALAAGTQVADAGSPDAPAQAAPTASQPATQTHAAGHSVHSSPAHAASAPSSGAANPLSALGDMGQELEGFASSFAQATGLKGIADMVMNNPALKEVMASFMKEAPSIMMAVEHVMEHSAPAQVASAAPERATGRSA